MTRPNRTTNTHSCFTWIFKTRCDERRTQLTGSSAVAGRIYVDNIPRVMRVETLPQATGRSFCLRGLHTKCDERDGGSQEPGSKKTLLLKKQPLEKIQPANLGLENLPAQENTGIPQEKTPRKTLDGLENPRLEKTAVSKTLGTGHVASGLRRKFMFTFFVYVVRDSGACLFGCARLSHCGSCCGPRPSLSGIGAPWVSLPGPTDVP